MIKRLTYIILPLLMACSTSEESQQPTEGGVGSVAITTETQSSISVIARSESAYEISSDLIPTVEELTLKVTSSEGEQMFYDAVEIFNTCDELTDFMGNVSICPLLLEAGNYTFEISDERDPETESDENAHFAAKEIITIVERDYSAAKKFTLTLQNSIVRLYTTESFRQYFENGAELTITTTAGKVLTYSYDGSSESGSGDILFVQAGTTLTLGGWAIKQNTTEASDSATKVTFTSSAVATAEAGTITTITVDANGVGTAEVTITVSGMEIENDEQSFELSAGRE